jgi:DNA-binding transcriptional regulator GbsR (MarR family)
MKGILWTGPKRRGSSAPSEDGPLAPWEDIAVEAVGNVIEFWGFKRNQGRVWALLYLRDQPMSAAVLEKTLRLSKGGVSMLLHDLERWGVLYRVRAAGSASWHYRAETELLKMVLRVIEEREGEFISRVRTDLAEALKLAQQTGKVSRERMDRLKRMTALAEQTEKTLRAFIKTARLDVGSMFNVFRERG